MVQSALDINYPPEKLTVYVLDDGRQDPVKQKLQVCKLGALQLESLGLRHKAAFALVHSPSIS